MKTIGAALSGLVLAGVLALPALTVAKGSSHLQGSPSPRISGVCLWELPGYQKAYNLYALQTFSVSARVDRLILDFGYSRETWIEHPRPSELYAAVKKRLEECALNE